MNIELIAIGLVVGIFVGISGVGGGSIMTPLLILVLGINPLVAVGTDLLYSVPTKILGAFVHMRQRTIEWKIVRELLWGGIPGVVLGLIALLTMRHYMDFASVTAIIKRAVGIALFISAGFLMYSLVVRKASSVGREANYVSERKTSARLLVGGGVVGFVVALTSIGSGAMTLPILLLIAPHVGIRRLVGTDIVFAAFLIPLAAAGHWSLGDINLPVALNLLVGSLPGITIGSKLCKKLPEIWLRPAISVVLVIAATRLV